MRFYKTDLTDLSTTAMTSESTHTFYSGFFANKNTGKCNVKSDGTVVVLNRKLWSFNYNVDNLADNIYEYPVPSWVERQNSYFIPNTSYFIVKYFDEELIAGVQLKKIGLVTIGDYSAPTVLVDDLRVANIITKNGSNFYKLTTFYDLEGDNDTSDYYTQTYDYTVPLSPFINSYVNELNHITEDKTKLLARPDNDEDLFIGVTSFYMMYVYKWSDDSLIFSKRFSSLAPLLDTVFPWAPVSNLMELRTIPGISKVVGTNSDIVVVMDYLDSTLPPVVYELPSPDSDIFQMWKFLPGKRIIYFADTINDRSSILLFPEIPCLDPLAATCDDVDALKSLTCSGIAELDAPTNTCYCPAPAGMPLTGFFHDTATNTCISCTPGCLTCSGPGTGDCASCPPFSNFDGVDCICIGANWLDMSGGGVGICSPCDVKCS